MAGCPTEAELLDAIEARLKPADGQRVNEHLQFCEKCRELIESLAERPAPDEDPLIGARLGDYVVEERIGQGGMGVVYRAQHPLIGKQVAVKMLRGSFSSDPVALQRLITEAKAVNAIGHRGIIDIFSFGELPDGRKYIVMEYLVGTPLNEYLRVNRRLTPYQTLQLLDDILGPLAAVHAAGMLHRDLKPSNLFLVSQPDGTRFVKVLDFGLSRRFQRRDEVTRQLVLGTPAYMAPELIKGEELGPFTDLYAVGVLAWQMLVGRKPFEDKSIVAVMRKQVHEPVPPISDFVKGVPAPLETWVMSLLEKEPRKRAQAAAAARATVRGMLNALSTEKTARADETELPSSRLVHPSVALPRGGSNTEPELPAAVPGVTPEVDQGESRDTVPHDAAATTPTLMERLRARLKGKG